MIKERLDLLVVERRLVESRTKAQWLILNGHVLVNGIEIRKPGKKIDNSQKIQLKQDFPYVGRGGLKLEAALKKFKISVNKKICADIGASIGGFTDCLLKNGALRVYAIDNAIDLLHPSLRCEKMQGRVIPLLGIDARKLNSLDEDMELITIDITFASLKSIIPNVRHFLIPSGDVIVLVKPIFETDFYNEKKFTVILDKDKLRNILLEFIGWSKKNGYFPYGIMKSPLLRKGGSIEFLIWFRVDTCAINYNYKDDITEILKD